MASVTKVSASTMAVMRLYEQKKMALDSTFGYYIATARNTNKSNITIRSLLLHQSGIAAGVGLPILPADVSEDSSEAYPVKAGNKVYLRKGYFKEVIWRRMLNVKVDTPKYVYSDLSMTYIKEVIENQTGNHLDDYVQKNFYSPLGMQSAGFNPLNRFPINRIVPTENEPGFRKTMLRGFVHDPMAAKYGGVSGNAGLFATANDLAILYQMILNKGTYGGTQYYQPATIDLFTSKQSAISRRGLGFDRMDTASKTGYPSRLASTQTYGHTGFTGTCFWVDPKHNLVYIFLSNRVYPTVNGNIYRIRTRENVQDVFYEAIIKSQGGK
jgi:CubicO group peptidase (beta-lactamase class C family)